MRFVASLAIGFFAGLWGGLVGLGGGVLMVPLMVELMKVSQHQAHGTSLVAIVFTGLTGAIAYGREGSVNWLAAVLLASTAVLSARQGARFAATLPEWKLKRAFGGFLLFVAFLLATKSFFPHFFPSSPLGTSAMGRVAEVFVLLLTGGATGFLSGLMGVGGGLVMVPVMVLVMGFSQHMAQGTSLAVIVPTGAVGAWTHWRLGHVVSSLVPGLICGILVGTSSGAYLAHLIPEDRLRILFVAIMLFMSLRFLAARPTGKELTEMPKR